MSAPRHASAFRLECATHPAATGMILLALWFALTPPEATPATTHAAPDRGPLVTLDLQRTRQLASAAIRQAYPGLDLGAFTPSYVLYVKSPGTNADGVVIADWIGKETIETAKGRTPDLDRRRVRKLRVRLAPDGAFLEIQDMTVWLARSPAPAMRQPADIFSP